VGWDDVDEDPVERDAEAVWLLTELEELAETEEEQLLVEVEFEYWLFVLDTDGVTTG
jgi:hypothetical protein